MCIIDKYINNGIFGFIHLKASIFLSNFVEKANCVRFNICFPLPSFLLFRASKPWNE